MSWAIVLAILAQIRAAGREGGVWLALIVALAALFLAWLAFNPVQQAADHVVAPVGRSVGILASLDVRCLEGWVETTGRDPDGQIKLKVCTSPNKSIIITVRENQAPASACASSASARVLPPPTAPP